MAKPSRAGALARPRPVPHACDAYQAARSMATGTSVSTFQRRDNSPPFVTSQSCCFLMLWVHSNYELEMLQTSPCHAIPCTLVHIPLYCSERMLSLLQVRPDRAERPAHALGLTLIICVLVLWFLCKVLRYQFPRALQSSIRVVC